MPIIIIDEAAGPEGIEALRRAVKSMKEVGLAVTSAASIMRDTIGSFDFSPKEMLNEVTLTSVDITEIPMPRFVYKSRSNQRGYFVVLGGRIVSIWNPWWCVWVVWYPVALCKRVGYNFKMFIRRFRGNDHGRHWNRRRSK